MKSIPLTQGKVTLVDDEDFEWLSRWKWCACRQGADRWRAVRGESLFNRPRRAKGRPQIKMILMHRQIMGARTGEIVDHANGNPLDNQKTNIRVTTQAKNLLNRRGNISSTSRFKGVCWDRYCWKARYKGKYLGVFENEVDAAFAYDRAASNDDPEFARFNFPVRGDVSLVS